MKKIVITIDGPAGAGKTTISKLLADRIGYRYVDTGALYRGIAFEALKKGVADNDDVGLEKLCNEIDIKLVLKESSLRLLSGDNDITDIIRTPEITMMASAVSARPAVRKYLLDVQRNMGQQKGVVFEGRDMGTVVFPEAEMKFFLDASLKTRALRRFVELGNGSVQSLDEVKEEMKRRDENDRSRNIAPLKPAPNAVVVDTTDLTIEGVVDHLFDYIVKKLKAS